MSTATENHEVSNATENHATVTAKTETPNKPASARGKVIAILVVLLLVAGAVAFYLHSLTYEDTDDAQVNGHLNSIAARVDGTVKGVYVENNHDLQAGQALVDLDPADYQATLEQSKAQLAQAEAKVKAFELWTRRKYDPGDNSDWESCQHSRNGGSHPPGGFVR